MINTISTRTERNVLFNDTINTFYLWLFGVRHIVTTIQIVREETCCRYYTGYTILLVQMIFYKSPPHRQESAYHNLCYTSRGALAGSRNVLMDTPIRMDPTTHHTMSRRSTTELCFAKISTPLLNKNIS